jgi:hypothetical protein
MTTTPSQDGRVANTSRTKQKRGRSGGREREREREREISLVDSFLCESASLYFERIKGGSLGSNGKGIRVFHSRFIRAIILSNCSNC